jgi:hypothetical protein
MDRMVVFQNFSLMPWMTGTQNVRLAGRSAYPTWSGAQGNECVRRDVEMVGLTGAENKLPAALSGGMKQRVGLARAFATESKALLLDEAFAQIDALTRGVIQEELSGRRGWGSTRGGRGAGDRIGIRPDATPTPSTLLCCWRMNEPMGSLWSRPVLPPFIVVGGDR